MLNNLTNPLHNIKIMTLPLLQRKAIDLAYYAKFKEFPTVNGRISKSGNIEVFNCSSDEHAAKIETTETNYTYTAKII